VKRLVVLVRRVLLVAVLAVMGGCAATIPPGAGHNPADPFERMNRHVYAFNDNFDKAIGHPVSVAYNKTLPKVVRECLSNIFDNLYEITNIFNAALQGKPRDASKDTGRLVINSTVGVGGCFDVAKHVGLERNRQNFGLTLGNWGIGPGPYLVLPILGPSTGRQAVGLIPDYFLTDPVGYLRPVKYEYAVDALRLLGDYAEVAAASKLLDEAALDRYEFLRDGYLQRTRSRVYDGNPPPVPIEEDPDGPDPGTPAPAGASPGAGPKSGAALPPAAEPTPKSDTQAPATPAPASPVRTTPVPAAPVPQP
jgi:phospholipid-binding lipoprotein MlaA